MASFPSSRHLHRLAICAAMLATSCGGHSTAPTQPTPPAAPGPAPVTVTDVRVGTAGNAAPSLAPGETLQVFAQATSSDGTTADVTNLAVWQSSNPVVATVSPTGLVTAAVEGALDVTATYSGKSGSLHTDVQKPGCKATLSPASIVFGALQSSGTVTVTTTLSTCRWTARSDAPWLSFQFDPNRSGNGSFFYSVPGNNHVDPRDANIIVSVEGGPAAVHTIHQERPVGCVYQVTPESIAISRAAGGHGSFTVTTVPGDCQWRIGESYSDITAFSQRSGTGSATITYSVIANAFAFDHTFRVEGLSGLNPPGIHTVKVQ